MVEEIIDLINQNLKPLIKSPYGIAEFYINKNSGEGSFAIYNDGNFKRIYNASTENSFSYFYKNGKIKIEEDEDLDLGKKRSIITYPLKLVAFGMRADHRNCNLSDDYFAEKILSCLNVKSNQLNAINVTSIETDKEEIFKENFSKVDYFFRYEQSIVSLEIEIVLNVKCLNSLNCG